MCSENYETSHQAQFKPYDLPNGKESLPPNITNQTSGFFRERALHIPNSLIPPVNIYFEIMFIDHKDLLLRLMEKTKRLMEVLLLNQHELNRLCWDKLARKKVLDLFQIQK